MPALDRVALLTIAQYGKWLPPALDD